MWLLLTVIACEVPEIPDDTDVEEVVSVTWPDTLRGTGLFADGEDLADGVVPFEVAWPLWSDGSSKERYLYVPEGAVIDVSDPDRWAFPVGTRAWKTFWRDGIRVETRFIERREDGAWSRVAYLWRADGSDADAVPEGVFDAFGTDHDVPSTGECFQCHEADELIGVSAIQLGADSPSGTLALLAERGLLSEPLVADTRVPGEGVVREALGYLHGNCGGCHSDHSRWAFAQDLRLRMPVDTLSPEASPAYLTGIDQPTRHQFTTNVAISPGAPQASQIYERMGLRDNLAMPPAGTEQVDADALAVIGAWITGLGE